MTERPGVSRTVEVAAPPEQVFALVSDLPNMGALSPENAGGRWLGGATGPAVGARFRGANRNGWRRWSTVVRVTACDPPRRFSFDVDSAGMAVSRWTYDIAPTPGGCVVTESWQDRRGKAMELIGLVATGRPDRSGYTAQSIEQTLAALNRAAEGRAATSA